MHSARIILSLLIFSLAIIAVAQDNKNVKFIFAGNISSFSDMSQFVKKKDPADVIFATAISDFSTNITSSHAETSFAVSLSSSRLPATKQRNFVSDLKAKKIHHAGLKEYGDFTTFSHGDKKIGFASFGSTPMSLMRRDSVIIKTIISRLKFKTNIVAVAYSYDSQVALNKSAEGYIEDIKYFSHLCIDAGADVVYVSGSNDPMPLELYGDRLIIYGQAGCPIEAELTDDGAFENGCFLKNGNRIIEMTREYFPDIALQLDNKQILSNSTSPALGIAHNLLAEASKYRGRSYKLGATGPRQFDCSGFTGYIFKLMGYSLPRTAQEQSKVGKRVERNNLQPGDLVFFKRPAARAAGHVGIVYSVNNETGDFTFIHASTTRGVVIENLSNSGYFVKRYMGARRVIEDKNETTLPAFTDELDGAITKQFDKKANVNIK